MSPRDSNSYSFEIIIKNLLNKIGTNIYLRAIYGKYQNKHLKKVLKKKSVKHDASKAKAALKPIGVVTHFFGHIKVMIAKFSVPVSVGTTIRVTGATTDFVHTIASMQFDHKAIRIAKKKQEVGIKVGKRVREGDLIYPHTQ